MANKEKFEFGKGVRLREEGAPQKEVRLSAEQERKAQAVLFMLEDAERALRADTGFAARDVFDQKDIKNKVPLEKLRKFVNFYKPQIEQIGPDAHVTEYVRGKTKENALQWRIYALCKGIFTDEDFYTKHLEETIGKGY